MDEQSGQSADRSDVVERREHVETGLPSSRGELREPQRSYAWLWVGLLLLVVGALAWYALSRGEPQQLEMPELDAPAIDVPAPEQEIEINVPDAGGAGEAGE